jgi:hypothetical protein
VKRCEHCDGSGQVHHGEGALHYVTLCPNHCALRAWDQECDECYPDWRCECGDLNRYHEAFCYRCGAGQPEDHLQKARVPLGDAERQRCERCEGDGSYSELAPCTTCGSDCACNGPPVIVDPCPDCGGSGEHEGKRT